MKVWQRLVKRWGFLVFGNRDVSCHVRCLRLLEEVMELCQAEGVPSSQVWTIAEQVYKRPVGDPRQELGGVMICVAAYAARAGFDCEEAFWTEFERIMDPAMMEKVRTRNLSGDKIGLSDASSWQDDPSKRFFRPS